MHFRVVGGLEVLGEMERVATDRHDKPMVSLCIVILIKILFALHRRIFL